jgi:signal transduction histidine kinase
VRADPRRLRQVLDGLAENALRVIPPGGPLVLATGGDAASSWLQVRDGGTGLEPEDYAVVFERGVLHDRYRGRRTVGSGGVGLALAHGLVTRMGGTIQAEPAPEGGACFTVAFPARSTPPEPTADAELGLSAQQIECRGPLPRH